MQTLLFSHRASPWQGPAREDGSASQRTFGNIRIAGDISGGHNLGRGDVSIYGAEIRDPAKPLTMHRTILQTKYPQAKAEKPCSSRSSNCPPHMTSNHGLRFVPMILPSQEKLPPFLPHQLNPLFKILQSQLLQEASAEHTRLNWAPQPLRDSTRSNILLVFPVLAMGPGQSARTCLNICITSVKAHIIWYSSL